MTEAEWQTCTEPSQMLVAVASTRTARKLRLLLTNGARRIWEKLTLPILREAVEVAERYTEGQITEEAVQQVKTRVYLLGVRSSASPEEYRWWRDAIQRNDESQFLALAALTIDRGMPQIEGQHAWHGAVRTLGVQMPTLFRELFGPLPFRLVPVIAEWRTDTALSLARQMYDSRDFSAMPILADALQDAGCDNDDILNHCRHPGEHVRGCWVVDLVLGKD
jgi:hypothetical protein